jgi:5'-nucleotidase
LLILLTNDDGIDSEGLLTLKEELSKKHEVHVVAPERERTCIGHAITLHKPLRLKEMSNGIYATNGTPVDAVYLGIKVLLPRKPDFVISGINKGPNMGQDVTYSGTVAAAKEGAFLKIPSAAISLCARKDFLFETAARVASRVVEILSGKTLPEATFLNINVPNLPHKSISDIVVTRLGKRIYNETVITRVDPRGEKYYWIGGDGDHFELVEGTDFHAIESNCISVSPLCLDPTCTNSIDDYRKYFSGYL